MGAEELLRHLADGEWHSGAELARELGVTRAAIWKRVAKLADWGLEVRARPGRGYRLIPAVDLLDRNALNAAAAGKLRERVRRIEVFTELASTNRYLLEHAKPELGRLDMCIAEFQAAGRGRRGRVWRAPLGAGLCLSVAWQFRETPPQLAALTLTVGVVARRVIAATAGIEVGLKWPNDLVWRNRKLGGVLLELNAEAQGGCHVVAGIGINVAMPAHALARLSDWPEGAADLATATGGRPPSRTSLALALAAALASALDGYAATGFAPYRAEWEAADYLMGRSVRVDDAAGAAVGIAAGIEADGALVLDVAGCGRRRVISGDVSVRAQP